MLMSCVYGAVLLRYVSLWGRRPCRPGVPILVKKPPRVAPTVSTRRAMLVYVALDSLESLDRDAHIKLCFNLDIANSRQLPGSARGALRWDSTPWGVRAAPSSSLPFRGSLYSLHTHGAGVRRYRFILGGVIVLIFLVK